MVQSVLTRRRLTLTLTAVTVATLLAGLVALLLGRLDVLSFILVFGAVTAFGIGVAASS